ncbi:hypothetical protein P4O66_001885 [Electrophorus voltai]|uniref:EGF-like domain-containing protein n=1 Tax=Electrophorus voltai TaxID=2609070 RepID=A0AAD9DT11_9TELE|nr:hypothetical protein P4O66_001885 [Electrophorus voltai]
MNAYACPLLQVRSVRRRPRAIRTRATTEANTTGAANHKSAQVQLAPAEPVLAGLKRGALSGCGRYLLDLPEQVPERSDVCDHGPADRRCMLHLHVFAWTHGQALRDGDKRMRLQTLPQTTCCTTCAAAPQVHLAPPSASSTSAPAPGFVGWSYAMDVDACSLLNVICPTGTRCLDMAEGLDYVCCRPCTSSIQVGPLASHVSRPLADEGGANPPCANGSRCFLDTGTGPSCVCTPGWEDPNCMVNINECTQHRCQNGATCIDQVSGYRSVLSKHISLHPEPNKPQLICVGSCRCVDAYSGVHCKLIDDHCPRHRCSEHSACLGLNQGHTCYCLPGYEGTLRETELDERRSGPCANGATCVDGVTGYRCLCAPSFEACQEVGGFQSSPVEATEGAEYHMLDWEYLRDFTFTNPQLARCTILSTGSEGDHCEEKRDYCDHGFCGNNSNRIDLLGGPRCEQDIDECTSSACKNGATCIDWPGNCFCQCANPFKGASNPCENSAECEEENRKGRIPAGSAGLRCELDADECLSNPCRQGFCYDGKPLPRLAPPSSSHASAPVVDNFYCLRNPGYAGATCEQDADDCISDACENNSTCVDLRLSYRCVSRPAWEGELCESQTDKCSSNPCKNGGTCTDFLNAYMCTCPPGWMGSFCGTSMSAHPHPAPMVLSASNHLSLGSSPAPGHPSLLVPTASCPTTFVTLLMIPACTTPPASHGSTVRPCASAPQGKGKQHCPDGPVTPLLKLLLRATAKKTLTTAPPTPAETEVSAKTSSTSLLCEMNVDECASAPCPNGGRCVAGIRGDRCLCPAGFAGPDCAIDADECTSSPCLHGRCKRTARVCRCRVRTADLAWACWRSTPACALRATELNLDACMQEPANSTLCLNAGTCVAGLGFNFTCRCQAGFTECRSEPCRHGGICSDFTDGYRCRCRPGWTGLHCEEDINECLPQLCDQGPCAPNDPGRRQTCFPTSAAVALFCQPLRREFIVLFCFSPVLRPPHLQQPAERQNSEVLENLDECLVFFASCHVSLFFPRSVSSYKRERLTLRPVSHPSSRLLPDRAETATPVPALGLSPGSPDPTTPAAQFTTSHVDDVLEAQRSAGFIYGRYFGDSFLEFEGTDLSAVSNITVRFQTDSWNGTLLYADQGPMPGGLFFIKLYLQNGIVQYEFSCTQDKGIQRINTRLRVNDGNEYLLNVRLDSQVRHPLHPHSAVEYHKAKYWDLYSLISCNFSGIAKFPDDATIMRLISRYDKSPWLRHQPAVSPPPAPASDQAEVTHGGGVPVAATLAPCSKRPLPRRGGAAPASRSLCPAAPLLTSATARSISRGACVTKVGPPPSPRAPFTVSGPEGRWEQWRFYAPMQALAPRYCHLFPFLQQYFLPEAAAPYIYGCKLPDIVWQRSSKHLPNDENRVSPWNHTLHPGAELRRSVSPRVPPRCRPVARLGCSAIYVLNAFARENIKYNTVVPIMRSPPRVQLRSNGIECRAAQRLAEGRRGSLRFVPSTPDLSAGEQGCEHQLGGGQGIGGHCETEMKIAKYFVCRPLLTASSLLYARYQLAISENRRLCMIEIAAANGTASRRQKYVSKPMSVVKFRPTFLGSVPTASEVHADAGNISGLTGCLRELKVNSREICLVSETVGGRNFGSCDTPACRRQPCRNSTTCTSHHPDPSAIQWAGQVRVHVLHGVCTHPIPSMYHSYEFCLKLMFAGDASALKDNLILFSGQKGQGTDRDDFFALGVRNGRIIHKYNLGSGVATIISEQLNQRIRIHTMHFGRQRNKTGVSPGRLSGLNAFSQLYVGGCGLKAPPAGSGSRPPPMGGSAFRGIQRVHPLTGRSVAGVESAPARCCTARTEAPVWNRAPLSTASAYPDGKVPSALRGCLSAMRGMSLLSPAPAVPRVFHSQKAAAASAPWAPLGCSANKVTSSALSGGFMQLRYSLRTEWTRQVGFRGGILEVVVNGHDLELTEAGALGGANVADWDDTTCGYKPGQAPAATSPFNLCQHGAVCIPHVAMATYSCACFLGWDGVYCDLQVSIKIACFVGNYYFKYQDSKYNLGNLMYTQVSFNLSASSGDGLILWMEPMESKNDDYLAVGLQGGYLKIVINLGEKIALPVISQNATLCCEQWNYISIIHNCTLIQAFVNGQRVLFEDVDPFECYIAINHRGVYYFGGFELNRDVASVTSGLFTAGTTN